MADTAAVAATPPQVTPKADETVKTPAQGAATASTPAATPKQEGSAAPHAAKAEEQPKPSGSLLGEAAPKESEKPKEPAPAKPDYSALKLPEGTLLPATAVDAVKAFAEKHNLSLEAAQAELEERHGTVKAHFEGLVQQHRMQVEKWKETVKAHPKFGGANLKATDEAVTQVFDRFAPKGLKEKVQADGYNWHPEFLEFLHNIHEATKSDTFVSGGRVSTSEFKPDLTAMYKTGAKK